MVLWLLTYCKYQYLTLVNIIIILEHKEEYK